MPTRLFSWLALTFAALPLHADFPSAQWEQLSPAEATALGWSQEKLAAAKTFADTLHTESVLVVTQGKILTAWGPIDQKRNVHSIRKSFLSALCGIHEKAGTLNLKATMAELGIDDNEPALTDLEKTATVHDLLKARSGIYHPALYETASMKAARPVRHSHAPGTFWYYNNWDFNALGTLYEQVTATSIYQDFKQRIAIPLGMEDYEVSDGEYVTGSDSIHRAYPFRMTARDMARFGQLFLRHGRWGDQQIVPAAWVADSVKAHSDADTRGGYGYLWWISQNGIHLPGITLPAGSYSARGAGGHFILIIPALDLVIVHRVNTDLSDQKVETSDFAQLVRHLLAAYQPPPTSAAASPLPLDTLLPLLMTQHRVPGAAVVEIADHQIVRETYLGTREAGKALPVTADTVFEAASMTKPLAAYAALKLVEQGQLDLDRPLTSYLPQPYLKDQPLHEKITARMVLSHTSGFPNWRKDSPLTVQHEPGTRYLYSGEGILFLQRVIEHLTGTDYETFIQQTLLQPLGMKSSRHTWSDSVAQHAAAGHDSKGQLKSDRRLYTQPNAAYSLYTTPRDYAAFVLEMMRADRSAPHALSAASLQQMLTPISPTTGRELLTRQGQTGQGDLRFGLGWSIEPTASGPRARHSGSNGTGFRCYTEFDPKKGHGIVIMTNSSSGDTLWQDLIRHHGIP